MKIIEKYVDVQTGEETITEREETTEEQSLRLDFVATQTEAEAKAVARTQILDRLGLTAEEASILLG